MTNNSVPPNISSTSEFVLLENSVRLALQSGDVGLFSDLLDDAFVGVTVHGTAFDKAGFLNEVRNYSNFKILDLSMAISVAAKIFI